MMTMTTVVVVVKEVQEEVLLPWTKTGEEKSPAWVE